MKNKIIAAVLAVCGLVPFLASANDIVSYKLVDDNGEYVSPTCQRQVNSSGTRIENVASPDNTQRITQIINNQNQVIATITPFTTYPNSRIISTAINDHNEVVGEYIDNNRPTSVQGEGFIWRNGQYTPVVTDPRSTAIDINDYGYVTGFSTASTGFVWKNGRTIDLPGLNTTYIFPECISDNGIITGTAYSRYAVGQDWIFVPHSVHWVPYDDTDNYNNGYDNYFNNNYNNHYNNGYNNGYNNNYNNGYTK